MDTTGPFGSVAPPTSPPGNQEELIDQTFAESPSSSPEPVPAEPTIPGDLHSRLEHLKIGKYTYCIYALSADSKRLESKGCEPEPGNLKHDTDQVGPDYILYHRGNTLYSITNYSHLCNKKFSDGTWATWSTWNKACDLGTAVDNISQFETEWKLRVSEVFPASDLDNPVVQVVDSDLEKIGKEYNILDFQKFTNPVLRQVT